MKKIAFICDSLAYRGGNIKQIIELANHFSSKKYDVTVFTSYYDPQKCFPEIKKEFVIKHLGILENNTILKFIENRWTKKNKMLNLIRSQSSNINYFIIHDSPYYMLSKDLKKYFRNTKLVWHMNDLPYIFDVLHNKDKKQQFPANLLSILLRQYDKRYIKEFKHITTLSNTNKKNIKKYFNIEANVVNTGTDIFYSQRKAQQRVNSKKELNLLTVGAFYPNRRYEDIILALDILKKKSKRDFKLKIIGYQKSAEEYYKYIVSLVKEKKLENSITFISDIDNEGLKGEYKKSDVFIQSTHLIGWTIPATEAMLSEVPTIITSTCGLNEFVTNRDHVLVVEPKQPRMIADAVLLLVENNSLYTKISLRGKQHILDNFTWEGYCMRIQKYIQRI